MNDSTMTTILAALKVDLGIKTTAYDERLTQIINSSESMITREGATLDFLNYEDVQIVVMYAAWLWRRRDTGEGMPRMLRWALNNKILGDKAR
ncbi:MAG: hypothetical protein IKB13_01965 [Clostridia bacterium]|nr:hypothetical protein [Clostridia bacterium]